MASPVRGPSSLSPFNAEAFRLMFENAAFGMVAVDCDFRFIRANAAYCHMLGYTEEELQGTTVIAVTHPDDREITHSVFQDLMSGAQRSLQKRYVGKDGSIHWTRVSVSPVLHQGQPSAYLAVVHDITHELQTEEELLKSETRFRSIFQAAGIGIALADSNGNVLEANPAMLKMLGYSAGELRGRNFSELTHAEDVPRLSAVKEVASGQRDIFQVEKRCLRKDGSILWGRLTTTAVRIRQGKAEFLLAMLEDVTEHKHLEDQVRHSQKMESVGQLAGGVAHDFNNLLTIILGAVYMGLDDPALSSGLRGKLQQIAIASERAAKLTEQLLTFSRKRPMELLALDVNQLLRDLHVLMGPILGKNIRLTVTCQASPAVVRADRGQIEQVLVNLAMNARDAMPGGGELKITTANATLDASAAENLSPGEYVVVEVIDSGTGIPEAIRHRVFEPFFTTKEIGKGTGLGLATAYATMEQHRGKIAFSNHDSSGTTFSVYLPATKLPVASHISTAAHPGRHGGDTIMVVEDEPAVLALVAEMLESQGYKVLRAKDAVQALKVSSGFTGSIDLLLTDLSLPAINGVTLANQLTQIRPSLKTVYMSGHSVRWLPEGSRVPLLQKPFSPTTLYQTVLEALKENAESAKA